jgi:hypothetical protein
MSDGTQALLALAEGQWGLVTRAQAAKAGVSWSSLVHLSKRGRLERVAHGVYRVRGATETDHLELRAAWLQLDPDRPAWARYDDPNVAVVSHTSAAALYEVGDLRADVHEFTSPVRRQTRRPDVRMHRGLVPPERRIVLGGLPVTRAGWMIGDLIADHVDPGSIAQITAEVLDKVLDYPRVIAESLAPHAATFGLKPGNGVAVLDHLLTLAQYPDKERLVDMAKRP